MVAKNYALVILALTEAAVIARLWANMGGSLHTAARKRRKILTEVDLRSRMKKRDEKANSRP